MRSLIYIVLILYSGIISAQSDFSFLNATSSSRSAALGGEVITSSQPDLSMFFENPALMDSVKVGQYYAVYTPLFGGIQRASLAYLLAGEKIGRWSLGMTYMDYGELERRDDFNNETGTFRPFQYALVIGKSHRLGPFSMGVNLKFAGTRLDSFQQNALLADLGGTFNHPGYEWVIGMAVKNLGVVFGEGLTEEVLDVRIGTTFKPQYMPFRFTLTASNLNDYSEPFSTNSAEIGTGDRILRYISLGTSLVINKALELSAGYNHRRRQELRLENASFGSGFSFGLMLKVKEFEIRYSRATFHVAGGANYISVQSNMNRLKKLF